MIPEWLKLGISRTIKMSLSKSINKTFESILFCSPVAWQNLTKNFFKKKPIRFITYNVYDLVLFVRQKK